MWFEQALQEDVFSSFQEIGYFREKWSAVSNEKNSKNTRLEIIVLPCPFSNE